MGGRVGTHLLCPVWKFWRCGGYRGACTVHEFCGMRYESVVGLTPRYQPSSASRLAPTQSFCLSSTSSAFCAPYLFAIDPTNPPNPLCRILVWHGHKVRKVPSLTFIDIHSPVSLSPACRDFRLSSSPPPVLSSSLHPLAAAVTQSVDTEASASATRQTLTRRGGYQHQRLQGLCAPLSSLVTDTFFHYEFSKGACPLWWGWGAACA